MDDIAPNHCMVVEDPVFRLANKADRRVGDDVRSQFLVHLFAGELWSAQQ